MMAEFIILRMFNGLTNKVLIDNLIILQNCERYFWPLPGVINFISALVCNIVSIPIKYNNYKENYDKMLMH